VIAVSKRKCQGWLHKTLHPFQQQRYNRGTQDLGCKLQGEAEADRGLNSYTDDTRINTHRERKVWLGWYVEQNWAHHEHPVTINTIPKMAPVATTTSSIVAGGAGGVCVSECVAVWQCISVTLHS
jgi:hypothetical protein